MSSRWHLHGSARRHHDEWAQLHAITENWQATWFDNTGLNLRIMPSTPPATSHLWAWASRRWLRVRIDVPHWWAAILSPDLLPVPDHWKIEDDLDVPRVGSVRHWGAEDGRTMQYRGNADLRGQETIQLLPYLATTSPFIGTQDTLTDDLRPLLDQDLREADRGGEPAADR